MAKRTKTEKPETEAEYIRILRIKALGRLSAREAAEKSGVSIETVERAKKWGRDTGYLKFENDDNTLKDAIDNLAKKWRMFDAELNEVPDPKDRVLYSRHTSEIVKDILMFKGLIKSNVDINLNIKDNQIGEAIKELLGRVPREQLKNHLPDEEEEK